MSEQWKMVGRADEFSAGLKKVVVAGRPVVVGCVDGRIYAFDGRCPHAGGPMEICEVDGSIVTCPLHAWRFDLGQEGLELHGYRPLAVKKVKTENGVLYISD